MARSAATPRSDRYRTGCASPATPGRGAVQPKSSPTDCPGSRGRSFRAGHYQGIGTSYPGAHRMNVHPITIAIFVYIAGLSGIAGFCLWTSRINQFFFFGRTLPQELAMSPEAKQITRRYTQQILIKFCATVVVFVALHLIVGIPLLPSFVLACILQIVGFHVAFARAHGEAGVAFEQRRGAMEDAAAETAPRVIAVPLLASKLPVRSRLSTIMLPSVAAGVAWLIVMAVHHMSFASLANAVDANGGAALMGFGVGMLFA